jgi:peroxiredoxin
MTRPQGFSGRFLLGLVLALCVRGTLLAQPAIPRPAPELKIGSARLSAYRGRVVLLAFISTQCAHCQRASQVFEQLSHEFGANLQVVDVAFNEAPDLAGFAKRLGLTYPVSQCSAEEARAFLGIPPGSRLGTPQVVVIDRSGMIRAQSETLGTPMLQSAEYLRGLLQAILRTEVKR